MKCLFKFWVPLAVLMAETVLFFLPVLSGEFLHWDDYTLFIENPYFRGFGADHWRWMCTSFLLGHWQPLSWLSYALDYKMWGMDPLGWHAVSLLLHLINALLVYFLCLEILNRKERRYIPAVLAALFWSTHPLRVEAVAWLATRGYLLCTAFCLGTVWLYLRASRNSRYPWGALLCFALSAATKGIGMMLPAVLLVIDWAVLGRMVSVRAVFRCIAGKIPFFMLSLLTGTAAFLAKKGNGGMASVESYGPVARAGQAVYGAWFYLLKTLSPANLSPIYYKRPEFRVVLAALILTLIAALLLFLFRRKSRPVAGAAAAALFLILPMLGFTQSGAQLFADRFTYLAAVPFSILLAAGLGQLTVMYRAVAAALAGLLLIFGVQTFVWAGIWSDSLLLWNQSAITDGGDARAYNGMGQAMMDRKAYAKAVEYFDKALAVNPRFVAAYQNRALVLNETGRHKEALDEVSKALQLDGITETDRIKMLLGRGQIAEKAGATETVLSDYAAVINDPAIDPFWRILALQVRARFYLGQGRMNEGIADLENILAQPDPSGEYHAKARQILERVKKNPEA